MPEIPKPPGLPKMAIDGTAPKKESKREEPPSKKIEAATSSSHPTSSKREKETAPPPSRKSTELAYRLAEFQVDRPRFVLAIAGLITVVAALLALRLRVLTGFEYLLPEDRPSVQELNRVAAKTAGVSTLFILLKGGDATKTEDLRKCADTLVTELAKVESPWVGSVEDGIHEAYKYLAPRAGLFADRQKLEKLRADVDARFEYEVAKATDNLLEETDPPPAIDPDKIRKEFGIASNATDRYPDGYYQSKDGKIVVVAVRSKVIGTDFARGTEAIRRIREVVDRVNPASFDAAITYGFAGDLQTAISEYTQINKDLTDVGLVGSIGILAVVFLFFLRIRTLMAMLLTIAIGVAWTFGATELMVGHLNMATGFLFTIIAGNGINCGIIYMARFLEARRKGATLMDGIRIAHRETWLPTLCANLAASASYGSLVITEFRGFRDFGLIGSVGMMICWVATYLVLPCILAMMEAVSPVAPPSVRPQMTLLRRLRHMTQSGVAFGKPFARIVPIAPRTMATVGTALALLGFVGTVFYGRQDPMEYNLKHLRNDETARKDEIERTKLAEEITGYVGIDGMAILVNDPAEVAPLRDKLYKRRDAAPENAKPFKAVFALQDFVPPEQAEKIPTLLALKDKVVRAHRKGLIPEADWKKLSDFLPPDDLAPFGMAELPEGVARPFTETDGTRGRIVYISPINAEVVDDAHYLFRWADSYRVTVLDNGTKIRGSGRAVIYADMWSAIVDDVPPAVIFSFAATCLVVILAFRAGRAALAVLLALLVGVGWMAGLLVVMQVKLNFLNFIALPITFGIGVDYAVNVVQRYVREGAGGALVAVRETGGAVILCSLTTTLGYLALVRSMNYAVRSLGIAAVLGEVSCLLAAVLVLPAGLVWLDRALPRGAVSRLSLRPPPRRR